MTADGKREARREFDAALDALDARAALAALEARKDQTP